MPDQLQAARDEIAEMCGYEYDGDLWFHDSDTKRDNPIQPHPIPACLNFVSRVWPGGWSWWRSEGRWSSGKTYVSLVLRIIDTGDELTDRMTLLLRSLKWLRDHDRPAFDAACKKIRKEIQV